MAIYNHFYATKHTAACGCYVNYKRTFSSFIVHRLASLVTEQCQLSSCQAIRCQCVISLLFIGFALSRPAGQLMCISLFLHLKFDLIGRYFIAEAKAGVFGARPCISPINIFKHLKLIKGINSIDRCNILQVHFDCGSFFLYIHFQSVGTGSFLDSRTDI